MESLGFSDFMRHRGGGLGETIGRSVDRFGAGVGHGAMAMGRGAASGAAAMGRGVGRGAAAMGRGAASGARAVGRGFRSGGKFVANNKKLVMNVIAIIVIVVMGIIAAVKYGKAGDDDRSKEERDSYRSSGNMFLAIGGCTVALVLLINTMITGGQCSSSFSGVADATPMMEY